MTAGPGLRFFREVSVTCTATVVNDEGHEIEHSLAYSAAGLMKPGVPELRQIKRFARGAGIDVKRSPDLGMPRELGAKAHEHVRARVPPKRC